MARVPADATAFAHRESRITINVSAFYTTPDEAPVHEAWVTTAAAALRHGDPGAYVNFLADEDEARVGAACPGATWNRLTAIKRKYDPTNLFRLNQNIPPARPTEHNAGSAARRSACRGDLPGAQALAGTDATDRTRAVKVAKS